MSHRPWKRLACRLALLGTFAVFAQTVVAQNLVRINGTGSGTGGMRLLAAAFMKSNPGVKVEVQQALGSSGGIGALTAGQIEVAISNRQLKENEAAKRPMAGVEYARTPFVVAVHRDVGVTALSSTQLAALFAEGAATFPNGKRARPVLRMSDTVDTELLKSFSPAVAQAVDLALKRRGMLNADTDSEAADLVENTAGAFAVSTLALIESEKRPLVALAIDGKLPTLASLADGSYPQFKPLFMFTATDATANTRAFAAFVQSAEGRALLRAHGHATP